MQYSHEMVHFLLGGIVRSSSTSLLTGSKRERQSGSFRSIFPTSTPRFCAWILQLEQGGPQGKCTVASYALVFLFSWYYIHRALLLWTHGHGHGHDIWKTNGSQMLCCDSRCGLRANLLFLSSMAHVPLPTTLSSALTFIHSPF